MMNSRRIDVESGYR